MQPAADFTYETATAVSNQTWESRQTTRTHHLSTTFIHHTNPAHHLFPSPLSNQKDTQIL